MISLLATDPSRYRCSPERMKKAWSSQDEVSAHVRQGRRQSGKGRGVDKNLLIEAVPGLGSSAAV